MMHASPNPIFCTHRNNFSKGKALCGIKYNKKQNKMVRSYTYALNIVKEVKQ